MAIDPEDIQGLLDAIGAGEGDYSSVNQGRAGDTPGGSQALGYGDLRQMTIADIMKLQALPKTDPKRLFAVGRYQIIPGTMKEIMGRDGAPNPSEPFDEEVQDKLITMRLENKRKPLVDYVTGAVEDTEENKAAALDSMANEFMSFENSAGEQPFGNVGGNVAAINAAQGLGVVSRARARYPKTTEGRAAAPAEQVPETQRVSAEVDPLGNLYSTADSFARQRRNAIIGGVLSLARTPTRTSQYDRAMMQQNQRGLQQALSDLQEEKSVLRRGIQIRGENEKDRENQLFMKQLDWQYRGEENELNRASREKIAANKMMQEGMSPTKRMSDHEKAMFHSKIESMPEEQRAQEVARLIRDYNIEDVKDVHKRLDLGSASDQMNTIIEDYEATMKTLTLEQQDQYRSYGAMVAADPVRANETLATDPRVSESLQLPSGGSHAHDTGILAATLAGDDEEEKQVQLREYYEAMGATPYEIAQMEEIDRQQESLTLALTQSQGRVRSPLLKANLAYEAEIRKLAAQGTIPEGTLKQQKKMGMIAFRGMRKKKRQAGKKGIANLRMRKGEIALDSPEAQNAARAAQEGFASGLGLDSKDVTVTPVDKRGKDQTGARLLDNDTEKVKTTGEANGGDTGQ